MRNLQKALNMAREARELILEAQRLTESYSPEWWQLNRAMNETERAVFRLTQARSAQRIVKKAMAGTVERVEMIALGLLGACAAVGLWLLVKAGGVYL